MTIKLDNMIRKLFYLLIPLGILFTMINSCEKDIKPITNFDLLTNNSSKIWCLLKIINADSMIIKPMSCILDDQNTFQINGVCLIDNMGTFYSTGSSDYSRPPSCKDTVDIVDIGAWTLNSKMDTLTVSTSKYVLIGKIVKLTSDSLIIKRTYSNSYVQTEFYVTKSK
jgi:hypothetical protein